VSQLDSDFFSLVQTCSGKNCVLISLLAVLKLTQINLKLIKISITYCNYIINIFNNSWHNNCSFIIKVSGMCVYYLNDFFPRKKLGEKRKIN